MIQLSDFEYTLPKELISQKPFEPRDSCRLMVLDDENIQHRKFTEFPTYLRSGDVIVLNDTKVNAFRLSGKKETGGAVDILVLSRTNSIATCLISGKGIHEGTRLSLGDGAIVAKILDKLDPGRYQIEFRLNPNISVSTDKETLDRTLLSISKAPLPPYIKEDLEDTNRYQTIYANTPGSAAAPTAGLHFTNQMIDTIKNMDVNIAYVTLHIGTGTFLHVTEDTLKRNKLGNEFFKIDETTANQINSTIESNDRLFVVGTSTLRALESSIRNGKVIPQISSTELFIYPGYQFKLKFHGLLTNFHLPRSTLLMLVCAYTGRERILKAYNEAIEHKYRFYSFGDAMLIFNNKMNPKK